MRAMRVGAGALALTILTALAPATGQAQTAPANCRGGATPVVTVQQGYLPPVLDPVVAMLGGNGVIGLMADRVTLTTTRNFAGVEGLTRFERHSWLSGTVVVFEYPRWLLDAYGGITSAIEYDLEQGFLRDRGPCS